MKHFFILISFVLVSLHLTAQNLDSIVAVHANEIVAIQGKLDALQSENTSLKSRLNAVETKQSRNESVTSSNAERLSTVENQVGINTNQISTNASSFDSQISEANTTILSNSKNIHLAIVWGGIIILLVLLISVCVSFMLRRLGKNEVQLLSKQADMLNEKIVGKLENEVSELQEIAKSLSAATSSSNSDDVDHSLVKALADRITFMEMTLYKMDPSVRGHRHLTRTISQMKDNLTAYGYELVEMLGKPYNEGMRVTANFVEDPDLEEGSQIITGIIKPQINFKGVMIQSAQITVSQNI